MNAMVEFVVLLFALTVVSAQVSTYIPTIHNLHCFFVLLKKFKISKNILF